MPLPESNETNVEVVAESAISGFDPDGEPVIRLMSDGSLQIQFEAMPPFFAEDAGTEAEFDDFRAKMEAAIGCPVVQDDRELFIINSTDGDAVKRPDGDAVKRIERWLQTYPKPRSG